MEHAAGSNDSTGWELATTRATVQCADLLSRHFRKPQLTLLEIRQF
jgi:hypothetical protein